MKYKKSKLIIFISTVVSIIFISTIIHSYINYTYYQNLPEFTIIGNSMEPVLIHEQKVKVDINYYTKNELKKGDIIAFKFKTQEKPFVKRIIALPRDKIIFGKDGNIYINNKKVDEPYLKYPEVHFNKEHIKMLLMQLESYNNTIPQGYALVMGDDRGRSFDSSNYGIIPVEYIVGKVVI